MSQTSTTDLKAGPFETQATVDAKRTAAIKTVQVAVDHKAATRQAIIVAIRRENVVFKTRSDWKAKTPATSPDTDWDYKAIAIHHAGNSYSCSADGAAQLRKAEATDIDSFGHLSYHYAIDCSGAVYEALDIRCKGAHIEGGNTGVIGIVFLADLSVAGEAEKYGPGAWNVTKKRGVIAGVKEWIGQNKDNEDVEHDTPTEKQLHAVSVLVKSLKHFFEIKKLGGHREYAKTHGTSRACPGTYGMEIAAQIRKEYQLSPP